MSILFLTFLQVESPSEQVGISALINSFFLNKKFCKKTEVRLVRVQGSTSYYLCIRSVPCDIPPDS